MISSGDELSIRAVQIYALLGDRPQEELEFPIMLDDETEKLLHSSALISDGVRRALDFYRAGWVSFRKAPDGREFYSSESPSVRMNTVFRGKHRIPTLFMPLSLQFAVYLIRAAPQGHVEDREMVTIPPARLTKINQMIVAESPRHVFCRSGNFNTARCLLIQNPKMYKLGFTERPKNAIQLGFVGEDDER